MPNEVEIVVKSTNKVKAGLQEAVSDVKSAGKDMGRAMDDAADDMGDSFDSLGSKLGSVGATAGAAAGVAAGGALAIGFTESLSIDAAQKKLQAQLGGTAEYSAEMGQIAGDLYANAYGDSMEQVGDAVATVVQSGALMEDATNEQIQSITGQAMSLADAFGVDVTESMRAVGQMVRTGMVPDAQAGLDLITVAFRQLGPQADDVLDTFNEYSTQFRKLGIDGPMALGLISQMVKGGARDTDIAADALKEFTLRAVDAANPDVIEGFKSIGLSAEDMARKFLAGGETANAAFDQTVKAIGKIKDPLVKNTVTMALFGTQAEDLGGALDAIDTSRAVGSLGNLADASKSVDDALGESAQAKITGMQRSMEQMLASFVDAPGILGDASAAAVAFGGGALTAMSQVGLIAMAMPDKFKTMAAEAVASFARMTASAAAHAAASIVGATASAAAWIAANAAMILATGGILLAIAAIIAIVVLLVKNWDWVKEKASEVWAWITGIWDSVRDAIVGAVSFVINWLKDNWPLILAIMAGPLGLLIKLVVDHWDQIVNFIKSIGPKIGSILLEIGRVMLAIMTGGLSELVILIIRKWDEIIAFFKGLPGKLLNALGNIKDTFLNVGGDIIAGIWRGLENGWNWLMDKVRNLAKSLLDAAKKAIGIGSPSKAFEDKFGAEIPPGAGRGVDRASGAAQDAVRAMAGHMLAAIPPDLMGRLREQLGDFNLPSMGVSRVGNGAVSAGGMNGSVHGQLPVVIRFDSSGSRLDNLIVEILRNYIQVQGGNVQDVLGR